MKCVMEICDGNWCSNCYDFSSKIAQKSIISVGFYGFRLWSLDANGGERESLHTDKMAQKEKRSIKMRGIIRLRIHEYGCV